MSCPEGRGRFSAFDLFDNLSGLNRITASPNPIQVCDGGLGQTTIFWNVTGILEEDEDEEVAEVEVRVGSETGNLLAAGDITGNAETGEWVTDGMVFYLLDRATGDLLDLVTVRFTEFGCPPPVLVASPNPIRVCDMGLGETTLSWDATDVTDKVQIRVGAVRWSGAWQRRGHRIHRDGVGWPRTG